MSNWQYHLEMKDLREKYDKDMDIKALAQGCVERITNLVANEFWQPEIQSRFWQSGQPLSPPLRLQFASGAKPAP